MKKFRPSKLKGLPIGNFKLDANGKLVKDVAASEAKLPVNVRLIRRKSKKVSFKPSRSVNKPL